MMTDYISDLAGVRIITYQEAARPKVVKEIQVCSLLSHVYNEIEYDLQYKPQTGNLTVLLVYTDCPRYTMIYSRKSELFSEKTNKN